MLLQVRLCVCDNEHARLHPPVALSGCGGGRERGVGPFAPTAQRLEWHARWSTNKAHLFTQS